MSEPNTTIKEKIFLLVIILFACIGIIPITLYENENDNKQKKKKNKQKKKQKITKKQFNRNVDLVNNKKKKLAPKINEIDNSLNSIQKVANTSVNVANTSKNITEDIIETVPSTVKTTSNLVDSVSDIVNSNNDTSISTEDNISTTAVINEEIQPFEEILTEENYQNVEEETTYSPETEQTIQEEIERSIEQETQQPIGIEAENSIEEEYYPFDKLQKRKKKFSTIVPNVISEENNESVQDEMQSQKNNEPVPCNNSDADLNLLSEISNLHPSHPSHPSQDIHVIDEPSNQNIIQDSNISDINFPNLKMINNTPYLDNNNVSSQNEINQNQIGIWYASPTTFLKITDSIAKLYIQTVSSTIVPSVIKYDPMYPGGIFKSKNFRRYKNNAIEFKYDSTQNIIELKYTDVQTNKIYTVELNKLSNKICKKILHKIKKTSVSPESTTLFLEILH